MFKNLLTVLIATLIFTTMTPLQAQKVNSYLGQGKDPSVWLSPRQVKMYRKYKNDPTAEERWNNVWVLE